MYSFGKKLNVFSKLENRSFIFLFTNKRIKTASELTVSCTYLFLFKRERTKKRRQGFILETTKDSFYLFQNIFPFHEVKRNEIIQNSEVFR